MNPIKAFEVRRQADGTELLVPLRPVAAPRVPLTGRGRRLTARQRELVNQMWRAFVEKER
jgi:hypothetical protein